MPKALKVIKRDKYLILLLLPAILYYALFHYVPMYGLVIAFKKFSIANGIMGSEWVGFHWFAQFFESYYFFRLLKNTILLSLYSILIEFPIPIVFALLLNEYKDGLFKRTIQTVTYMPHFLSVVIVVGIMVNFLHPVDGVINTLIESFGYKSIDFFNDPSWFRTLYIGSSVWQNFGFSSIIYLAAISAIDPQLYEAARMDGANRWQQMWSVTLPGILPVIMILLILRVGNLLDVGFEKIILMYNPSTYEVADVISTYVYRRGILGSQYSFGAAVGLFNAIINFVLLIAMNRISKKLTQNSLW
ncbi:ABC transporter permease subunit [Paenibacillus sp. J5C_2022]|uniref:ABC transporter permease n=1 Tax=Paenibacillus sp. J5C2022 TaxID=2977129 RepID=UPI0021D3D66B|nr:ABC transporter permease subunit [Paenibacillus sp. J5C2022]MCU6710194.1 ABC transporter permease subunit [Paenibacillus sp. J5C2022]